MRLASGASSVISLHRPPRRSRGIAQGRGFTLIEMLMAVALISIVAVAASPAFLRLLKDRRVNRQAMWIVNYLRTARLRAIGRGMPVVVQVNQNGNACAQAALAPGTSGTIRLLEAELNTLTVPKPTCNTQNWTNANISELAANNQGATYETPGFCTTMSDGNYIVTFYDDGAPQPNQQAFGEICYSPTGRTYVRYNQAVPFSPLVGVPTFQIANASYQNYYGFTVPARMVFLPPNGPARMAL